MRGAGGPFALGISDPVFVSYNIHRMEVSLHLQFTKAIANFQINVHQYYLHHQRLTSKIF